MTTRTLLVRSLRFYWRTHLGVVLGTALGAMVLVGALLVGDSVKATLRRQALERVGRVQSALVGGEHFFREHLATDTGAAPLLLLRGSVSLADGTARANSVQVLGVTDAFWNLALQPGKVPMGEALANTRLAQQLGLRAGSDVIIRLEKPTSFSKDAPLSGSELQTVAVRASIAGEANPEGLGNFSLQANQVPPSTIFLPLSFLQQKLGVAGKVNALLHGSLDAAALREAVLAKRQLADAELELRPTASGALDLRTSRVFLEPPVVAAAPPGAPALTYLVNELRVGERATPYSMATAGFLPKIGDDEVIITQWLADDLQAAVGAKLTLKYFVMGERRQLTEASRELTVAAILPMEMPGLDSSWTPDFPGLSDRKNCRDWEPGFAMDTTRIRPRDEQYWQKYRGTPKAFVSLKTGQEMWGNRWGNLTSIRYASGMDPVALLAKLPPERAGMNLVPLRGQALAATKVPIDFGQLFLGFSFFLLVAAAVLTGLLFVFSLEQRNEEAGLLLGLGWPVKKVRRLLLTEGAWLAALGSVLGAAGGLLYTWAVLRALGSVWKSAVGSVTFDFSVSPLSVVIGIVSSLGVAMLAVSLASRRQLRQSAQALLSASTVEPVRARGSWSTAVAAICLLGAGAIVVFVRGAGAFFGAGSLLLIAGIAFVLTLLRRTKATSGLASIAQLGVRNATRRRGRSVATVAVLASGVFMVVAVDSFRKSGEVDATDPRSGTGGFPLLAESAAPLYEDLNTEGGRQTYALGKLDATHVVPMRVKDGDDASCLNLNRALQPRLLGVKPSELSGHFSFAAPAGADWSLLGNEAGANEPVPAIADAATLEWALQIGVGDTLTFLDERGAPFQVKLVASLAGTVLQGSLLISEANFVARYPGAAGYRYFLIEPPAGERDAVAKVLSVGLEDYGLEVVRAEQRLAELHAVENTYLAIFQALGGLGLLLGSAGLAIVVARNVLERRREFGLLEAVGFRPWQMRALVFAEHRWLLVAGLSLGVGSALLAVWPSFAQQARGFPWKEMAVLLSALLAGSLFWIWLATRLSLRGERLSALRSE